MHGKQGKQAKKKKIQERPQKQRSRVTSYK